MRMVDIMYKYINRFINSNDVLEMMKELDGYNKKDQKILKDIEKEIRNVIKNVPNEEDEVEKKRKKTINSILEKMSNIKNEGEHIKEMVNSKVEGLKKDLSLVKDGGEKAQKINAILINNPIVERETDNMSSKDLLEFITDYISVPCPPKIDQKIFDEMVEVGIKEDQRESLWRLAFNYEFKDIDFTNIVDYFILKRDYYYLTELISAVGHALDMDYLIDKVIKTEDKEFIANVLKDGKPMGILDDKSMKMLEEASK